MGSSRTSVRARRSRVTGVLATLIQIVGGLLALILVVHIGLALGEANPGNTITKFVAYWADQVQLGFRDLFTPADPRLRVAVNYGIPAVVWLVVSSILARLLRRLG
jgi:hypothetical protein